MKTDKFQFTENFKTKSEEITLVAVIVVSFFSMYAMNRMEPKTIIINQTIPSTIPQANFPKPEEASLPLSPVAAEGNRVKLEIPLKGQKLSDGVINVPQVPVLPRPLNGGDKSDYQKLMAGSKKSASTSSHKAPVPLKEILEEDVSRDDGEAGVHVVLGNKNSNLIEAENTNEDTDEVNVIIKPKEKTEIIKPEKTKEESEEIKNSENTNVETLGGLSLKLDKNLSSIPEE